MAAAVMPATKHMAVVAVLASIAMRERLVALLLCGQRLGPVGLLQYKVAVEEIVEASGMEGTACPVRQDCGVGRECGVAAVCCGDSGWAAEAGFAGVVPGRFM